jgi:hypothetical protein
MKDLQALSRRLKSDPLTPESTNVRLYRAVSWLICASEQSKQPDLAFISHWIAFNALYAADVDPVSPTAERERFRIFIRKLVSHDEHNRIYSILWEKFSGSLRVLIENKYLFKTFWDHQRGLTSGWEQSFQRANEAAMHHLNDRRVSEFLEIVLDRLYILRNQLIHGGSTFRSSVNRESVKTGNRVLELLVPVFVDIMMKNPGEDWGEIHFPVVKG